MIPQEPSSRCLDPVVDMFQVHESNGTDERLRHMKYLSISDWQGLEGVMASSTHCMMCTCVE